MRILLLSNLYPPYYVGGYELGCQGVVAELRRRGHEVLVLTSRYGVGAPVKEKHVWRVLPHEFVEGGLPERLAPGRRLLRLARRETTTRRLFGQAVAAFRPELLWVWNLRSVSVNLAFLAERSGIPVCYFISDEWPLWLEMDPWYAIWWGKRPQGVPERVHRGLRVLLRASQPLLRAASLTPVGRLRMEHAQFTSRYLATANRPARRSPRRTAIAHWGVDLRLFPWRPRETTPKRLLFVGQLAPEKGVHTAVEALALLRDEDGGDELTLTITGKGRAGYERQLRQQVKQLDMVRRVRFAGFQPHQALPRVYAAHDVLLFPSQWNEPFGITPLEAMASGLPVVATATGGSSELFEHEANALVFPAGDAARCAEAIRRLRQDQQLRAALVRAARRTVEERFTIQVMVDKLERDLIAVGREA